MRLQRKQNRCKSCLLRLARVLSSTQLHQSTQKGAAGIRRMRRLTPLRTMRRLWVDASAAAMDEVGLSLERGRDREKKSQGASGGKRAQAGAPTRGKEAEPYEFIFSHLSQRACILVPEHAERRRPVFKDRPERVNSKLVLA